METIKGQWYFSLRVNPALRDTDLRQGQMKKPYLAWKTEEMLCWTISRKYTGNRKKYIYIF